MLELIHSQNKRKLELLNELIDLLSSREPIDYAAESLSIEDLNNLNNDKELEVKTLQKAWEVLEDLLFRDLQITVQEKNQLVAMIGTKRKEDKLKKKKSRGRNVQVWRAD